MLGFAHQLFLAEYGQPSDLRIDAAQVAHGFDDVARPGFTFRANHRRAFTDAPQCFAVNKQDAFEYPMLTHQVFRRWYFVILLFFFFGQQVNRGANRRSRENNAACFQEFSAAGCGVNGYFRLRLGRNRGFR